MSTHIGFLHEGRILQSAPTDDIYYRPGYLPVAEYLGEPPMNILPVTLTEADGGRVFEGAGGLQVSADPFPDLTPGDTYQLGFRPQDMALVDQASDAALAPTLSFVETVGTTSTLHMELADHALYALSTDPVRREAGASLPFALDAGKLYVYAPDTGKLVATGDKIPSA
jgi:ABC-type sugar transport system ATPase subunit